MKYLVLRGFWSFGKWLTKGTYADESEIRSPRLRVSEGKIVTAVPSSNTPAETVLKNTPPDTTEELKDKDSDADQSAEQTEDPAAIVARLKEEDSLVEEVTPVLKSQVFTLKKK